MRYNIYNWNGKQWVCLYEDMKVPQWLNVIYLKAGYILERVFHPGEALLEWRAK